MAATRGRFLFHPVPRLPSTARLSDAFCRALTRREAKSFYRGMALTPEPKRSALFAVYAWMRAADDAADGPAPAGGAWPAARLAAFGRATDAALAGPPPDDHAACFWPAFARAVGAYGIERRWLDEQLAGQADDLGPVDLQTDAELERYCDRVAGSVGRVCTAVWGHDDNPALPELVALRGRALQRTNILRDVAEDAGRGRVYVPRDSRDRFAGLSRAGAGTSPGGWFASLDDAGFIDLMNAEIDRARQAYDASAGLEAHLHPDGRASSWALMEVYRRLLERIARDPGAVRRGRVALPVSTKLRIAARAWWRGGR